MKSRPGNFYTTPVNLFVSQPYKSSPLGRFLLFQEGIPASSTAPCRNDLQNSIPGCPSGRTGPVFPGLTSLPALAGDEDHDDEEHEEEQQGGQDVAQLLEKVHPALRDDDIDDIVAPDHVWI